MERMRTNRTSIARARAHLEKVEAQRTALYLEARRLEPPVTIKALADAYGVTEAAIMQKVNRGLEEERASRRSRKAKPGADAAA